MSPTLQIVVLNHNKRDLLMNCLASIDREANRHLMPLHKGRKKPWTVIVVDNGSQDGSIASYRDEYDSYARMLVKDAPVKYRVISLKENVGYSKANNMVLRLPAHKDPDFTLFLNEDTEFTEGVGGTIDQLMYEMNDVQSHCVAGVRLTHPDGSPQIDCGSFPSIADGLCQMFFVDKIWPSLARRYSSGVIGDRVFCDFVCGAAMLIRTSVLRDIGGFDEDLFTFSEEPDLMKRLHPGRQKMAMHSASSLASIIHHGGSNYIEGGDTRIAMMCRSMKIYLSKHHGSAFGWTYRGMLAIRSLTQGIFYSTTLRFKKARKFFVRAGCLLA